MKPEELVIIFKQKVEKGVYTLIPIDCVCGFYDDSSKVFIDEKEYVYSHFTAFIPGRCFGMKQSMEEIYERWPNTSINAIRNRYLEYFKKGKFIVATAEEKIKLLFEPYNEKLLYEVEAIEPGKYIGIEDDGDDEYDDSPLEVITANNITDLDKSKSPNNIVVSNIPVFNAKETRSKVKETIIGQDKAVDKIVTTIWRNLKRKNGEPAKNILISGPTASGKTEIFRTLSKIIDIPMVEVDANTYTAAGYIGGNVEDILLKLIRAANGDLVKASHGIAFIDEIDKLAGTGKNDEISTTKVQDSLLKLIEGNNYRILYENSIFNINTASITFVGAGSFARAEKNRTRTVGFNSSMETKEVRLVDEELVEFGFEPELLGRFPVRVALQKLDVNNLVRLMLESNKSDLIEEIRYLKSLGINTVLEDGVVEQIAKKAYATGNGARGISRIITDIFDEIFLEISNEDGVYKELMIMNGITDDNKRYVLKK